MCAMADGISICRCLTQINARGLHNGQCRVQWHMEGLMLDTVLLIAGIAFFAIAVLYGIACNHL